MKKITAVLSIITMAVCLAACGGGAKTETTAAAVADTNAGTTAAADAGTQEADNSAANETTSAAAADSPFDMGPKTISTSQLQAELPAGYTNWPQKDWDDNPEEARLCFVKGTGYTDEFAMYDAPYISMTYWTPNESVSIQEGYLQDEVIRDLNINGNSVKLYTGTEPFAGIVLGKCILPAPDGGSFDIEFCADKITPEDPDLISILSSLTVPGHESAAGSGSGSGSKDTGNAVKDEELSKIEGSYNAVAATVPGDKDTYYIQRYEAGGQVYDDPKLLSQSGLINTWFRMDAGGTGVLCLSGSEMEVGWKDGKITMSGSPLFTYEILSDDTVVVDMGQQVRYILKKGMKLSE
ncbi:MAG: hypothetical protein Q4E57_05015 [Eubacteriales bacterium]|nr:hypothetical protein [Eubacteriales bacterium]